MNTKIHYKVLQSVIIKLYFMQDYKPFYAGMPCDGIYKKYHANILFVTQFLKMIFIAG